MTLLLKTIALVVIAGFLALTPSLSDLTGAGGARAAEPKKKSIALPKASPARAKKPSLAEQYCLNIADEAADARMAWQARTIQSLSDDLTVKIEELEARTAELKKWMKRREDFVNKATGTLIEIYAKMRPDAAAIQLKTIDMETASAVLSKLKARTSSAILNEMDPEHAAKLATVIAGSAKTPDDGGAS